MNAALVLAVLLGVMLIVTGLQTVQLVTMGGALASGSATVRTPSASAGSSQQAAGTGGGSGGLANLPSMVGGC